MSSIPRIAPADLQDPNLDKLNRVFSLIADQLSSAQGHNGPFTFSSGIIVPSAKSRSGEIPKDDYEFLTLGAAKQLFAPDVIRDAFVRRKWFGTSVQPLPQPGGPGSLPSTVIEAHLYCDGAGLTEACINNAIQAAPSDGAIIHIKAADWTLNAKIEMNRSNIYLQGDGEGTRLNAAAGTDFNDGLIEVTAGNCGFLSFLGNGGITSSTQIDYPNWLGSPRFGDPSHPSFTKNSFIFNKGQSNLYFDRVVIKSCGGYAVYNQCRTQNVENHLYVDCELRDNIAITFGDGTYPGCGSITGGIFYQGGGGSGYDATVYGDFGASNVRVVGLRVKNITGTTFWSHLYGLDNLHKNIYVTGMQAEDIGRDGVLMGGIQNGAVSNGEFFRIGYIGGVPKYYPGQNAVAIDTAGYCANLSYAYNRMYLINGGAMDLDGLSDGTVIGNVATNPEPGDADYTTHQVANYGFSGSGNVTYGLQTNNTYDARGARKVHITGNYFRNMGKSAMILFNAQECYASVNLIWHPADAIGVPVLLGCSGNNIAYTAPLPRLNKLNVVTKNWIYYSPGVVSPDNGGGNYCIVEVDDYGVVNGPNSIYENSIFGLNKGEYLGSPTALAGGSNSSLALSTNSGVAGTNWDQLGKTVLRREGIGSLGATKLYSIPDLKAGTASLVLQVGDTGIVNASLNGAVKTGAFTLGARTTFGAFVDYFYGGKAILDGMLVLGRYNADTAFFDTEADALTDDYGILRYRRSGALGTGGEIQISVATSAGTRTWVTLGGGGGTPGGATKSVQINDAGAFYGETNLEYDKTLKRLTVTGLTGTAGIVADTCYFQSNQGFLATRDDAGACFTLQRTAATAGIYQHALGADGLYYITRTDPGAGIFTFSASAAGAQSKINIGFQASGDRLSILDFQADATYTAYALRVARWNTGANADSYIRHRGTGALSLEAEDAGTVQLRTNGSTRLTISSAGMVTIGATVSVDQVGNISFTAALQGTLAASAIGLPLATAANAINVPLGGVTALSLISVRNDGDSGLVLSRTSATAREYGFGVNSSGALVVRDRTGALDRLTISTAGLVTIGSTVSIAQNGFITFTGQLEGSGGSAGINVSTATTTNAIQAPAGGVTAKWLIATDSLFFVELAAPAVSAAGQSRLYMDSTSKKVRISQDGGAYVDLVGGGAAGVSSLNGLTGALTIAGTTNRVTVSAAGSTITLNAPQDIHTAANVTFGSVTTGSGGVVQSGATGASTAFQTTNFNFQVDGNGNISGAGSINMSGAAPYRVAGTTVIDSSRNGSFASITASGSISGTGTGSYFDTSYNTGGGNAYRLRGAGLIDNGGIWISAGGINMNAGCAATGYNIFGGTYLGQTFTLQFQDHAGANKSIDIRGGIVVSTVY